jgi:hypothetical protein
MVRHSHFGAAAPASCAFQIATIFWASAIALCSARLVSATALCCGALAFLRSAIRSHWKRLSAKPSYRQSEVLPCPSCVWEIDRNCLMRHVCFAHHLGEKYRNIKAVRGTLTPLI